MEIMASNNNSKLSPADKKPTIVKPFAVKSNDILGRYLVASKDLKPGETILQERPVVVGPSAESSVICLGCYRSLRYPKYTACGRCGVAPLCSPTCGHLPGGHSASECDAFAASSLTLSAEKLRDNMQIVMPLRCVLLASTNKPVWQQLLQLESHADKRRGTSIWNRHQHQIIQVLREWKLVPESMSDDLLHHVTGILDVNSFEVRVPLPGNLGDMPVGPENCVRGLYLEAALMAHDCIGNTHLAVDDQFLLTVRSSVATTEGALIYFNYTNTLQSTNERQQHLREGKYFECTCPRCVDPTELGIHLSSILCPKCKEYVSPTNPMLEPSKSNWKCSTCERQYKGNMITCTLDQARDQISQIDKTNFKETETLLKKLSLTLPPENTLILDLKQSLIASYRDVLRINPKPHKSVLTRKYELCSELLPLLEKVEPGISRLRGIALYEMHIPLVVLANREYEAGDITADQLLSKLLQADGIVREAVRILLYEPQKSPEGRLARQALGELKMITDNIRSVQNLVNVKKEKTAKRKNRKMK